MDNKDHATVEDVRSLARIVGMYIDAKKAGVDRRFLERMRDHIYEYTYRIATRVEDQQLAVNEEVLGD